MWPQTCPVACRHVIACSSGEPHSLPNHALCTQPADSRLPPDTERPIFGPIVHACTSTTNPLGAKRVHGILSAYFNEDRPMNGTLVPDSRSYKCSWLRSDTAFWWAALKHGAYVNTAAMVLRLGGNDKLSRKVRGCDLLRSVLSLARCGVVDIKMHGACCTGLLIAW